MLLKNIKIYEDFKTNKEDYNLTIGELIDYIGQYQLQIVPILTKNEELITQEYNFNHRQFLERIENGTFMGNELKTNIAEIIHTNINSYSTATAPVYDFQDSQQQEIFNKIYKTNAGRSRDEELFDNIGIFGMTYEIVTIINGGIEFIQIDPREAMIIRKNDLKKSILCGLRFNLDDDNCSFVEMYGTNIFRRWECKGGDNWEMVLDTPNLIKICPMIKYVNNKYCKADAAPAETSLKDLEITLTTSSELTHYMAQPLLAIRGFDLKLEDYIEMCKQGVIALPSQPNSETGIEFVAKPESVTQLKFHIDQLLNNIYRDTFCPRLDASGDLTKVASGKTLQYLYISTSAAVQRKITYITKSLKERIKIILALANYGSNTNVFDPETVNIQFTPNLPTITSSIVEELVQLAQLDILSKETLLNIVPNQYVQDIKEEMKRKEKEDQAYSQAFAFNNDEEDNDEEEK